MLSGYAVVGAIGFLVGAGVLHFLLATTGVGPIGARLVSFPIALAVTFILNRQLVFAGSRHSLAVAIPAYVGVQGVGYLVNMAIYSLLVFSAPWPLSHPLVALAVASGVALWSITWARENRLPAACDRGLDGFRVAPNMLDNPAAGCSPHGDRCSHRAGAHFLSISSSHI